MKTIASRRVETAADLSAFLGAAVNVLAGASAAPVFVGDREVCAVELQEGEHPTLGTVRNVVLVLGPRPGHTD